MNEKEAMFRKIIADTYVACLSVMLLMDYERNSTDIMDTTELHTTIENIKNNCIAFGNIEFSLDSKVKESLDLGLTKATDKVKEVRRILDKQDFRNKFQVMSFLTEMLNSLQTLKS